MKLITKLLVFCTSVMLINPSWAEESALDVVKNTSELVIEQLKNESAAIKTDPGRINQLVDQLIVPKFDFPKMSRWVLGKNWRTASAEQKTRFTSGFQKLLIRTYANALVQSTDVTINYLPVRTSEDGSKSIVKTEIDRNNGGPLIPIEYRLYKNGDHWLVYDVSIDNVSLVSTYRGTFNTDIKNKGLDSVINSLESRS